MKIMIIDDVYMNIRVLQRAIEEFGTIDGVQVPEEGLEKLRVAYAAGDPYDLLLLDIVLPRVNGLDLLGAVIRMGEDFPVQEKTKVVMVTSRAERESIVRAIQGGASGYVLKPFQPERVKAEVRRLFRGSPST